MKCPICQSENLIVIDSRKNPSGIRRRRECQECLTRFRTQETVILESLDKHLFQKVAKK